MSLHSNNESFLLAGNLGFARGLGQLETEECDLNQGFLLVIILWH